MASGSASSLDDLQRVLAQVVRDAVDDAGRTARESPERLLGILDDTLAAGEHAVGEAVQLAETEFQRLKDAVEHPDWLGLLSFILVKMVELVGDPRLTVVAVDPGAPWGRAVGLRYLTGDPGGPSELRVAFALGGEGMTHGVIVTSRNAPTFDTTAGPTVVHAAATGDGEWRIPFAGPLGDPTGIASFTVDAHFGKALLDMGGRDDGLSLGVGGPRLAAHLAAGTGATPTSWSVDLAFGNAGTVDAGIHGRVDLAPLLGVLAAVVALTPLDERYSPRVTFARGAAPSLDLGHVGAS